MIVIYARLGLKNVYYFRFIINVFLTILKIIITLYLYWKRWWNITNATPSAITLHTDNCVLPKWHFITGRRIYWILRSHRTMQRPYKSVFPKLFTTTDHIEKLRLVADHLNYLKDLYLSIFHMYQNIQKNF